MIPVLIFSAFVLPINYIIKHFTNDTWVDYMLLMDGNGFPIIGDFANLLKDKGLHIVFSLIMLFILYCCKLEDNTYKEISKRAKLNSIRNETLISITDKDEENN